jgi:hypothetical protein
VRSGGEDGVSTCKQAGEVGDGCIKLVSLLPGMKSSAP